jgi:hypothetical protein
LINSILVKNIIKFILEIRKSIKKNIRMTLS